MDYADGQMWNTARNSVSAMTYCRCQKATVTGREGLYSELITLLIGLISHLFAGGSCKPVAFNKEMEATEVCLMWYAIFSTFPYHLPSAEQAQLKTFLVEGTCSTPELRCGTWWSQVSPVRARERSPPHPACRMRSPESGNEPQLRPGPPAVP